MYKLNRLDWANNPVIHEEQMSQPWHETHVSFIPYSIGYLYRRSRFVAVRRLYSTA